MLATLSQAIAAYCSDTRALEALPTSTETTFYPDVRTLITSVLRAENLPTEGIETWPLFGTTLVNLHVHERGSVVFPRETVSDDLLAQRDANIAEPTWRVLRDHFGLAGERTDANARAFVGKLFRIAFAVLHAPSYQAEHKSALSSDWAHLPIPKDPVLFSKLVHAGEQVVRLLDANRDVESDEKNAPSKSGTKHAADLYDHGFGRPECVRVDKQ